MTRAGKVSTLLVVVALGIWGCAKNPNGNPSSQTERIKTLETKCARLEEDYRAAASTRDQVRKHAAVLEEERAQVEEQRANLEKELTTQKALVRDLQKTLVYERDSFKQQLEQRTNERDLLNLRCDRLKKGLQSLIGQDDAMSTSGPVGPALFQATSNTKGE
jgi:septal ring factor EnvC (AmiA/AmiB activator)